MLQANSCLLSRIRGFREAFGKALIGVFQAFQGKKNGLRLDGQKATRRGQRDILPALAWLSLAGLLASRARLRFTRQNAV